MSPASRRPTWEGPTQLEGGYSPPPVVIGELDLGEMDSPPVKVHNHGITDGDEEFWNARPELAHIRDSAKARLCAPWAVFAACVSRVLVNVRPGVVLPPTIGGAGSLNWFAALGATSGGGKGAAVAVSKALVLTACPTLGLGSGEGLVQAFNIPEDENGGELVDSIQFVANEIDNVAALSGRSGSTLMPMLCSAFSGERLGFTYSLRGSKAAAKHIPEHEYRMTLLCSVQPGRAGALFDAKDSGTPQRFMWFPATDNRMTRNWFNPDFEVEHLRNYYLDMPYGVIKVPKCVDDNIVDHRVASQDDDVSSDEAHATFARAKLAFALAVMNGRNYITEDDWYLSGIAAEVSNRTREHVRRGWIEATRDHARARGEERGVERAAADISRDGEYSGRVTRLATRLLGKIEAADGPVTKRAATQFAKRNERALLDAALRSLVDADLIDQETGERGGLVFTRKP